MADKLLTVKEVAERLGVGQTTIYDLCRIGKLGHYKIGTARGSIRFSSAHVDDYLQDNQIAAESPKTSKRRKLNGDVAAGLARLRGER